MKTVQRRYDRDLEPIAARIYKKAERRQREDRHEQGRQRLRDRMGFTYKPPKNFRERCRGVRENETPPFDFIEELRKVRARRERRRKIFHP